MHEGYGSLFVCVCVCVLMGQGYSVCQHVDSKIQMEQCFWSGKLVFLKNFYSSDVRSILPTWTNFDNLNSHRDTSPYI